MADSYEDSALRHFQDAELLKREGRLDNAGHLIGFSAECAIKHGIESLRPSANAPHGHFPEIMHAARKHLKKTRTGMENLLASDLLIGWKVDRRYCSTNETGPEEIEKWFQDAKRVLAAARIKLR